MRFSKRWRLVAFTGALVGSAGMVVAAATATGAYFNDTQSGQVTGTFGSIKVSTSGGTGSSSLDFGMTNMLPGQWQTITVHYKNTGLNTEDVYLVFNNAQALHAVNNLGQYGEAKITSGSNTIFYSTNLSDGETTALGPITETGGHCSSNPPVGSNDVPLSSANEGSTNPNFPPGCWPIPDILKLAANVQPGQAGTMTFSFAPGPKWSSAAAEAAQLFCYPLVQGATQEDQTCTTNSPQYGLPYQIVATQPGVAPNNPDNTTPTP